MLTETAATVYNAVTDKETGRTVYMRTVIPAVHWEDHRGVGGTGTSHPSTNGVSVFIPFSVADQMPSGYLPPEDFVGSPAEVRAAHWTLAKGDILLKGVVSEEIAAEAGIKEFMFRHRDAVTVQAVDTADYGSYAMRHWEVAAT